MEKKAFYNKKGKKDFKANRQNKEEEKSLFPYAFLGINLESALRSQISNIVYKSITDLSEAFSSFSSSDILSFLKPKDAECKQNSISILGVAVVPTNIVALIVLTDELVENKFPHITFLIGNYKPVMSNNVMIALFDKGAPYEGMYDKIKKGEKCPMKEKVNVMILDIQNSNIAIILNF